MTWDKTKPQGTEPLRYGDDRIRELKADLENALQQEHFFPQDVNNPLLHPKIVISSTPPQGYIGRIYYNNLSYLRTICFYTSNGWQIVSDNRETLPSGTHFVGSLPTASLFFKTVNLATDYALRLGNWQIQNVYGGTHSPTSFTHYHNVSSYSFAHSHSITTRTPQAQAYHDSIWFMNPDTFASPTHRHTVYINFQQATSTHTHTPDIWLILFKHQRFKLYKIEY